MCLDVPKLFKEIHSMQGSGCLDNTIYPCLHLEL